MTFAVTQNSTTNKYISMQEASRAIHDVTSSKVRGKPRTKSGNNPLHPPTCPPIYVEKNTAKCAKKRLKVRHGLERGQRGDTPWACANGEPRLCATTPGLPRKLDQASSSFGKDGNSEAKKTTSARNGNTITAPKKS